MKSIGFIGLGTMGTPMARNLLKKGYGLIVYNRTADKTKELAELGAEVAATPEEAARVSEVLITMLADDEAVMNVFYGTDGILHGTRPGMTVIDCSTVSPGTSRQLHSLLDEHLVDFLDAPVTGSREAAEAGELRFLVGGRRESCEGLLEMFHDMGGTAVYVGSAGAGSCAKLAHSLMVGAHVAALSEAMMLATGVGIDPDVFLHIVSAGGAASKQAELRGEKMIDRAFDPQFSLQLMLKDLQLASQLSHQFQFPAPLLQAAMGMYQIAGSMGLGKLDSSAVVQCYEQWAHRQLKRSEPRERELEPAKSVTAGSGKGAERRKSTRVPINIDLKMSVYQWEQEGSFSGHDIEGKLSDLSEYGLQIVSSSLLAPEMFVVIHFPQEAKLPPITVKILRAEKSYDSNDFHYGCMISGLPPYTRLKLEQYIREHSEKSVAGEAGTAGAGTMGV
jgi:3-hydroxyisobutyrate dehydrogenase-like beta-hydroxyacid dehydrogenase